MKSLINLFSYVETYFHVFVFKQLQFIIISSLDIIIAKCKLAPVLHQHSVGIFFLNLGKPHFFPHHFMIFSSPLPQPNSRMKNYVLLSNYYFFGSIFLKIVNFNGLSYHYKVRTSPTQHKKRRSSDSDSKSFPSPSCSNGDLTLRSVVPKGLKISKMVGG